MSAWRRAVKPEQREQRRESILAAADALFRHQDLAAISMAEVAKRASLAKGTLYLYYPSKEALFLALLSHDYERWFDAMDAALVHASAPLGLAAVTRLCVLALKRRPEMLRLIALLHTRLEQNIDLPTAERFKRLLLTRVTHTGAHLEACLPFLKRGEGAQVLTHLHALIVGLYAMAEPAPVIRQVAARPEMADFRVDFYNALARALNTHLAGLRALAEGIEDRCAKRS